jgi:hypothetical protein
MPKRLTVANTGRQRKNKWEERRQQQCFLRTTGYKMAAHKRDE